jgi:hypothetical protein
MSNQHWLHDKTNDVYYRVTPFKHTTGRLMEEWYCSNGDRWYLSPGITRKTVLHDCVLVPCEPIPGMLSITFD